jgi:hypothetical protein
MLSRRLTQVLLAIILCAGCKRLTCAPPPLPRAVKVPERLLFVGNSFTYYNGGLENHVKQLAESAKPPRRITSERATQGGATLKILHGLNWVHDKMRTGGYDLVILQEDIPELTEHSVAPFFEQARLFDQEIRGLGSKTVLFMAWPYQRLKWVTLKEIAQAHRAIGQELGVPVAPVGVAFQRAMKERPELAMLGRDKEHESIHGTYLAANVIYATIFRQRPKGLPYRPAGVSAEEAGFLQDVAWATVQEWQRQQ